MRDATLFAALLLAGCAEFVTPDPARLQRDSVELAGHPTRAAVARSAPVSAPPAGQADAAGRAIADMEFPAAALPFDPRYHPRDPLLSHRLALARSEWRGPLGIAPEQSAQPAIDGLYTLARGSAEGAPLRLPEGIFTSGGLARLELLPALPQTAQAVAAASRVQFEMHFPHGRQRL